MLSPNPILTVEDMRKVARRRVPRMFFGYIDSGSWSETTRDRNQSDFANYRFRQRVAIDISRRKLGTKLLGQEFALPLALAPTGMAGMLYPNAEIEIARAAEAANIPYIMSTMSICPLETVARSVSRPFWFQLYVMRDRKFVRDLIRRAKIAECAALVVTLDLQVIGQRHADLRNTLAAPPKPSINAGLQILSRPRWLWRMARAKHLSFGNIVGHVPDIDHLADMAGWTAKQFDPALNWDRVREIRNLWPGPLILKGILDPEDAQLAADTGADAIVVSNHGGRQLDGAPSTISVLEAVCQAVGDKIEVHMDGGIRSGQDMVKAICLGAKAVHIGRPFLYGVAARGGEGVSEIIEILRNGFDLTTAFCGVTDVDALSRDNLYPPPAQGSLPPPQLVRNNSS